VREAVTCAAIAGGRKRKSVVWSEHLQHVESLARACFLPTYHRYLNIHPSDGVHTFCKYPLPHRLTPVSMLLRGIPE
jgi:hypothetical protein